MPHPGSVFRAVRRHCLDCSAGSPKYVTWCPCDGVHSTSCDLWPFRFGLRPETAKRRYGAQLLTPELMPPADVNLDELPTHPPRIREAEPEAPGDKPGRGKDLAPEQRQAVAQRLRCGREARQRIVPREPVAQDGRVFAPDETALFEVQTLDKK